MGKMSLILLISVIMVIGGRIAYAELSTDSDSQNSVATLNIPDTGFLDICTQANASKTLNQDGDAEIDFEAGYTDFLEGYPTLTVKVNKGWKLSARSSGFSANGAYIKGAGDLMLINTGSRTSNGFNAFKSLSLENQEIASYNKGVKNDTNAIQYRIKLDWAKDVPGTYTATVTYTLSTNT